jgi:beta-phosphoglucomutase-like phosphatase (HAD superfamily)
MKHVIFDVDGVLVNSAEANWISLQETMRFFDFHITDDPVLHLPIPTTAKIKHLEQTQNRLLTDIERVAFTDLKFSKLLSMFGHISFNDGAKACVCRLLSNNINISYVSNARVQYINMIVKTMNLPPGSYILGNDSGFAHKPSADMFLHIAKAEQLSPGEMLVVDDEMLNLESAKSFGFSTFKVNSFDDLQRIR